MPGVDFNVLRSEITMEQVLDQLGFQPSARSGQQLHGPCPVHGSTSPSSRSFSVNLSAARYYCHNAKATATSWNCGQQSIVLRSIRRPSTCAAPSVVACRGSNTGDDQNRNSREGAPVLLSMKPNDHKISTRPVRETGAISIVIDPARRTFAGYWDVVKTVVADLEITDDEVEYVLKERDRLKLNAEQIRVIHAKAFASVLAQFAEDKWLDDGEVGKLNRLHSCLAKLGWAPGQ